MKCDLKEKRRLLLISIIFFLFSNTSSYACAPHEYEQCTLWVCYCLPKIDGAVGEAAERLKKEGRGQLVGPALAEYIIQSRNSAINGALPIPPHIRSALTGYADNNTMNQVRYRIQDHGALNLGRLTMQFGGLFGNHVSAVTLFDVIIFRGPTEANNPALWAHELVHVAQFSKWGVKNFAISYARDSGSVEEAAYASERGYSAWAQGASSRPNSPQQWGTFCDTQVGRFGPGEPRPVGEACLVDTQWGEVMGRIGF